MAQTPEEKAAAKAAKEAEATNAVLAELAAFHITKTSGTEEITPLQGTESLADLKKILKTAQAAAKDAAKNTSGVATVTFHGGTREFSKEIHGADYKKVATEFAETHKGAVVE